MNLSAIINAIQRTVSKAPIGVCPSNEAKKAFQDALKEELYSNIPFVQTSDIEYNLSNLATHNGEGYNDKCDVYIETERYIVIVELDATRADQVAKKMLSRYYYANKCSKPMVYVCLLYPGTEKMSTPECVKYMNMGKDVLLSINSSNRFIGAFINGNNIELKLIG